MGRLQHNNVSMIIHQSLYFLAQVEHACSLIIRDVNCKFLFYSKVGGGMVGV